MKKNIFIFIFVFIFYNFLYSSSYTSKFIITGVAPNQKTYQDWVEILTLEDSTYEEISKLRLKITHYNTSKEFMFSSIIPSNNNLLPKGKFVIVYINTSSNTYSYDSYDNLVIYTTYTLTQYGMYASDVIVSLKDSATNYLDVLCFTDKDGSTGSAILSEFNVVVSLNQWSPGGDFNQNTCVASDKVGNDKPFVRIKGPTGLPVDTNTKNDWQIVFKDTPGWGYKEIVATQTQKVVEVDKKYNPFCPEDENNKEAVIVFSIPDIEAKKTIKIFDIKGKEVITLLENDVSYNQTGTYTGVNLGTVLWNGKDIYGNRVPTGVYVVYFEAYNSVTGRRFTGKDVVIVGKQF